MALSGQYPLPLLGLTLSAAYMRVNAVEIITAPGQPQAANITYAVYADETARRQGKNPVAVDRYQVTGDLFNQLFSPTALDQANANPIKSAYLVLKTLDAFKNFSDV